MNSVQKPAQPIPVVHIRYTTTRGFERFSRPLRTRAEAEEWLPDVLAQPNVAAAEILNCPIEGEDPAFTRSALRDGIADVHELMRRQHPAVELIMESLTIALIAGDWLQDDHGDCGAGCSLCYDAAGASWVLKQLRSSISSATCMRYQRRLMLSARQLAEAGDPVMKELATRLAKDEDDEHWADDADDDDAWSRAFLKRHAAEIIADAASVAAATSPKDENEDSLPVTPVTPALRQEDPPPDNPFYAGKGRW